MLFLAAYALKYKLVISFRSIGLDRFLIQLNLSYKK